MTSRAIQIIDIEKSFGRTRVLERLTLDVAAGEFLTLLGPSGCGKSTLLRLIAGFEPPSAGRIVIGGRDLDGMPPKARDVAMIFQSYALYPHMSVRANIGMPLEMRRLTFWQRQPGVTWISPGVRRIRAAMAREVEVAARNVDLAHLLDRRPAELSGGQRQRVAVARALVRQPSVFLMDEPLSNLDAKLRIQLREEISELHRRTGITVIYVTHDQGEAMAMSDRIAVMEGGRVVQCGTPDEIYNRPKQLSMARFVGASTLNEIAVEIRGGLLKVEDRALPLRVTGVPDGPCCLAVRPEAFQIVAAGSGRAHFELPVVQTEFIGAEITLRCDGRSLGTPWVRVQMRAGDARLRAAVADAGQMIGLRLPEQGAMLFDASGASLTFRLQDTVAEARDVLRI